MKSFDARHVTYTDAIFPPNVDATVSNISCTFNLRDEIELIPFNIYHPIMRSKKRRIYRGIEDTNQ